VLRVHEPGPGGSKRRSVTFALPAIGIPLALRFTSLSSKWVQFYGFVIERIFLEQ
jgi:hypothetical protein